MSTHTTHFCDHCNSDHDISHPVDDGHAINYSEYPIGDGWAEFGKPYTDSQGYTRTADSHVCAHCLADPEFDPARYGTIPDWDTQSRENLEKGRKHAEAFTWAEEHLGTRDRWGWRGVRQIFSRYDYGHQPGPKLADGRFSTSDKVYASRAAA